MLVLGVFGGFDGGVIGYVCGLGGFFRESRRIWVHDFFSSFWCLFVFVVGIILNSFSRDIFFENFFFRRYFFDSVDARLSLALPFISSNRRSDISFWCYFF